MVSVNISFCKLVDELNGVVENNPELIQQYPILQDIVNSAVPNPPSVWTRDSGDFLNCQDITSTQLDMRRKAEIFLYKKNANDQTKKEKYALLAKGINFYKKRSWATQSEYYTNPNVNNLPQVGYTLVCGDVNNQYNCSPTTNNDVPGPIINICYEPNIPLTNYVVRREYTNNGTKWPQTAWQPGNNGFPVGKAGRFLM